MKLDFFRISRLCIQSRSLPALTNPLAGEVVEEFSTTIFKHAENDGATRINS